MTRKSTTSNEQISESNTSFESTTNEVTTVTSGNTVVLDMSSNSNKVSSSIPKSTINSNPNGDRKLNGNNSCVVVTDQVSNTTHVKEQHFIIDFDVLTKFPTQKFDETFAQKPPPHIMDDNEVLSKTNTTDKVVNHNLYHHPSKSKDEESPKIFDCLNTLSSSVFQIKPYSMCLKNSFESTNNGNSSVNDQSYLNEQQYTCVTSKNASNIPHFDDTTNISSSVSKTYNTYDKMYNGNYNISSFTTNCYNNNQIELLHTSDLNNPDSFDFHNLKNCQICDRKLCITSFKCKCGYFFCNKHRHAELHNCSFDYKNQKKDYLRKTVTSIFADKVRKI